MPVDEADRGVGKGVDTVAREFDGLFALIVHDGVVGFRGHLQHVGGEPLLVAAAAGGRHRVAIGEVPLADVAGGVARVVEVVGERFSVRWQRDAVAEAAGVGGPAPGLKAGASRATDRLRREGVGDVGTFAGDSVKGWREVERIAAEPGRVPPLLIGEEDDDVGWTTILAQLRHETGDPFRFASRTPGILRDPPWFAKSQHRSPGKGGTAGTTRVVRSRPYHAFDLGKDLLPTPDIGNAA